MNDLHYALRRVRVISWLRRHDRLGGSWRYDIQRHEWIREDGVRVYARCSCTLSVGGLEEYYTSWYVARPIEGPIQHGTLRGTHVEGLHGVPA